MNSRLKRALVVLLSLSMVFTLSGWPVLAESETCLDEPAAVVEEVTDTAAPEVLEEAPTDEAPATAVTEPEAGEAAAVPETASPAATREDNKSGDSDQTSVQSEAQTAGSAKEEAGKDEAGSDAAAAKTPVKAAAPSPAAKEASNEVSDVEQVKEMISKLPNCSDVKEADRAQIEAAQAAYEALSAEEQAALDEETGTYAYDTSQPYGRVLESALWGLWSLKEVDNTTTLAPGTYDAKSDPKLISSYSKGKSTSGRQKPWSVRSITVDKDHKVTAVLTVESSTYDGIYYQGQYYEKTNTSGNCTFEIPIELNTTFYFSGDSSSMPVPIAFSVTTSIDESGTAEEEADYSAVDAALKKVPKDLSIYTDETVNNLNKAINAVVRGKMASEQAAVDKMAKDIEDAVAALKKKDTKPVRTNLTITNKTGMFKAVDAYLLKEGGKEYLVMSLSGTGYHELFKGTYETAAANGDGTAKKGNGSWIHGHVNSNGKWEFKIPLESGESYVPCVAISNTYYGKYLNGQNALERAFYPRQFTIDRKAKTLVTDDYNETVKYKVTSKVADFKTESTASAKVTGGPNSNNYTVSMTLVMKDGTYDEVYYPTVSGGEVVTAKAAIKNGKFTITMQNAPMVEAFKDKKPVEMTFHVAADAPYSAAGKYVTRTVTINKKAGTIVIKGSPLTKKGDSSPEQGVDPVVPFDPTKPDKPGGQGSHGDQGGSASAVDASTTLADGEYTPDSFSWSGGSGRLAYIRCNKITVRGGKAYATIEFSSPNYDSLKASGGVYSKQGGGNSVFVIPVNLNANNTIVGRTTAMSQPHWITYTIYIGKAETAADAQKAKEAKKEAAEAKLKISDKAPTIIGLGAAEEDGEDTVEYAKYFRIFNYEDGVKLLSIDISQDTALLEEYTENSKRTVEVSESEDEVEYDEDGKVVAKSPNEYIEEQYRNNVVNYLLVPEDYEVPAGLDKEYIIVRVPSKKTFMASPEAISMMEQLGCLDAVSLLGMDEKEIKQKDLKESLEDEKVKLAGDTEKPDYAKVVKDKTDLAILPGDMLPDEIKKDAKDKDKLTEEAKAAQQHLEKVESRFTTLNVPVIVDRSAQEKDELAQAEWIKVYGALYGCEEQADKVFEELVKKADKK